MAQKEQIRPVQTGQQQPAGQAQSSVSEWAVWGRKTKGALRVQQSLDCWSACAAPVKEVECVFEECGQQHVLEGQGREVVVQEQNT